MRSYRDDCLPKPRAEGIAIFSPAGPVALSARRASDDDPAHCGDAVRKKGKRNAAYRAAAARERECGGASEPVEEAAFARGLLLLLMQSMSLSAMKRATGLSLRCCSIVRRRAQVPHLRHWKPLKALTVQGSAKTAT